MKTSLKNRVVWYDGDISISPECVEKLLISQDAAMHIFVDRISETVNQYNKLVPPEKQLIIKDRLKPLSFRWQIPEQYTGIDINKYVLMKLIQKTSFLSQIETEKREQRTLLELELFKRCGLNPLLKALVYIVETMEASNVVWGVGRGSSVASYVLFLIGVHDVDSVAYNINQTEFFKIPVS